MAEFKFVKADGSVLDYSTGYVVVEKMVPTKVRVPLFDANGVRLSVEDLAEKAGLKLKYIPHQTAEYLAFAKIQFMYGAVPEFAGRVAEFKAMYDFLGIAYDAKTEDVEEALVAKFENAEERADYYAKFQTALLNVKINYQAGNRALYEYEVPVVEGEAFDPVDDFIVWSEFPVLVKWLPGNYDEAEIPVKREEEIVADSAREAAIREELANE
jgi:hypothetical protein